MPGLLYGYKRNEYLLHQRVCAKPAAEGGSSEEGAALAQVPVLALAVHAGGCAEAIAHAEEGHRESSLVAAGHSLTVVCGRDETFVRGGGKDGALGLGEDAPNCPVEKLLCVPSLQNISIVSVACGRSHTLMITSEGVALSWGANEHGQLGLGEDEPEELVKAPKVVLSMRDKGPVQAACGAHHSLIVTEDGSLYGVGWNLCGQLGLGVATDVPVRTFTAVTMPTAAGKVIQAAAGHSHSVALTPSGLVYEWGRVDFWWGWGADAQDGTDGEVLDEEMLRKLRPRRVFIPERASAVSCGFDHSAVLTRAGNVYTFGTPLMGSGLRGQAQAPMRVDALSGKRVTSLASGYAHTVAIVDNGEEVYAWGCNSVALGTGGGPAQSCKPARVEHPSRTQRLRMVSSGCCAEHSIFCYSSQLSQEAALAFLMGTHVRLGASSKIFGLDPCIAAAIAKM
mmetsp:Transcript_2755/g.6777  ORF Transcript_2755/g.6777 Transcript_2755/m.6777 type:complete len:452 (-) Transcript_2755:1266-2621(-)